jgi:hypothetical protein
MTRGAELLKDCALARPSAGGCAWCGAALPLGRRRWCRDACSEAFWKNHWWSLARQAAKRRDRWRCVRCGRAAPKRPSAHAFAAREEYLAAFRGWRAARKTGRLEVNHREPCAGLHGTLSCLHHLDNLETLCVPCHRLHTAALPRARGAGAGSLVG